MRRKVVKPNYWDCHSCENWDDVNGCWANCKEFCFNLDEDITDIATREENV